MGKRKRPGRPRKNKKEVEKEKNKTEEMATGIDAAVGPKKSPLQTLQQQQQQRQQEASSSLSVVRVQVQEEHKENVPALNVQGQQQQQQQFFADYQQQQQQQQQQQHEFLEQGSLVGGFNEGGASSAYTRSGSSSFDVVTQGVTDIYDAPRDKSAETTIPVFPHAEGSAPVFFKNL